VSDTTINEPSPRVLDRVVIRFAGDSGDGMQLAGDRFTTSSALFGNDLATFPDFPAEIRAPAGTLAGVSAFQVHISDHDILTPGDDPNVLVAMNPAALKANVGDLAAGMNAGVGAPGHREGRPRVLAQHPAQGVLDGLLHGALTGDHQLFAREDGIEETWRIVQPLLDNPGEIHRYEPGSWGPDAARELLRGHRGWQQPWLAGNH